MYSHLERRGTLPEDWCQLYTVETALALDHVHSHGFVYRDLKAENVLLAANGHIKLADFGLAKKVRLCGFFIKSVFGTPNTGAPSQVSDSGGRKTIAGTPHMLAPEILINTDGYGASADWWTLGLFLADMLIGESPLTVEADSLSDLPKVHHISCPGDRRLDHSSSSNRCCVVLSVLQADESVHEQHAPRTASRHGLGASG